MADINATFGLEADFSSAIAQTQKLAKEVSALNAAFNSLDKNAVLGRNQLFENFKAQVGQIGGFNVATVDLTSSVENFGKALDKGKLSLREYYKEARTAFKETSNARKLAELEIRRAQSVVVGLGGQNGRNKAALITPQVIDMTSLENQMAVARKQFDIFNKLVDGGTNKLINWGKNTQWAGRQLTVGLTVPLSILASTTAKAFNDVDKELTRLQKVYGSSLVPATAASTNAMRNEIQALAVDFARSYGVAAKETAGLAADLAATGLEGKKLTDSVTQTTRLAVLGEVSRQDAMKTTLALQNAFKVSSKDLADNINFLNAVENQTSTSLQDLTAAIPRVGPVIKNLGGDVKDLSLLLVAMKEGGISAEQGANAIKSGLASLINPTKAASQAAAQYGIDIAGIVKANKGQLMPTILAFQQGLQNLDELSKQQILEKIFGKYQVAKMTALFDNLNASGSQTQQVLKLMGASQSDLAKIANQEIKTLTESTSMRFQRAMEGIKASLLPVGQTIVTSIIPVMDKFASALSAIVSYGQRLPEPIKSFLKFSAGITAIAGPLVMMTGVLSNFIGYIAKGAMGFVNLGRRIAGLPTKQFEMLDNEQLAASKSSDILTEAANRQASSFANLAKVIQSYSASLKEAQMINPWSTANQAVTVQGTGSKRTRVRPRRGQQGGVLYAQNGSWVPGTGSGDTVPAMLEPGEFVVNRNAASKNAGLLENINGMQSGGFKMPSGSPTSQQFIQPGSTKLPNQSGNKYDRSHILDKDLFKAALQSQGYKIPTDTSHLITTGWYGQVAKLPRSINSIYSSMESSNQKWTPRQLELLRRGYPTTQSEAREVLVMMQSMSGKINNSNYPEALSLMSKYANGTINPIDEVIDGLKRDTKSKYPQDMLDRIKRNPSSLQSELINHILIGAEQKGVEIYGLSPSSSVSLRNKEQLLTQPFAGSKQDLGKAGAYRKGESELTARLKGLGRLVSKGRLHAQSGAWVPGQGSGDRVPAMLEPGEFVVNKKAAMKHGGLLQHLNFNDAPRFQSGGGVPGYALGGIATTAMFAQMVPGFDSLNETLKNTVSNIANFGFALSLVSGGVKKAFSTEMMMKKFPNAMNPMLAKGAVGEAGKLGQAGSKLAGSSSRVTQLAGKGILSLARSIGMLLSPAGLAVGAIAALGFAMYKYNEAQKKAADRGKAVFAEQTTAAEVLGVSLTRLTDRMKDNAAAANALGYGSTATAALGISAEDKAKILGSEENKKVQEALKGKTLAQQQSVFTGQYAQMLQQGFTQEQAGQVLSVLAQATGSGQALAQASKGYSGVKTAEDAQKLVPQAYRQNLQANDKYGSGLQNIQGSLESGLVAALTGPNVAEATKNIGVMISDTFAAATTTTEKQNLGDLTDKAIKSTAEQLGLGKDSEAYKTIDAMGNSVDETNKKVLILEATAANIDVTPFLEGLKAGGAEADKNASKLKAMIANVAAMKNLQTSIQENAQKQIDSIQGKMTDAENAFSQAIDNTNAKWDARAKGIAAAQKAEDRAYNKKQRANEDYTRGLDKENEALQKQSDTIQKSTDNYLKKLEDVASTEEFLSKQRQSSLSGLKALSSGDVLGFIEAQQQQGANAKQYGRDLETKSIQDAAKAAQDKIQLEVDGNNELIKQRQELAFQEARAHEDKMQRLSDAAAAVETNRQNELQGIAKNHTKTMQNLQAQMDLAQAAANLSSKAYTRFETELQQVNSEAVRAAAIQAALTASSKGKTAEEAIAAGEAVLKANGFTLKAPGGNANDREGRTPTLVDAWSKHADGGHIKGAGGPTDDKIPAMLSNGEYVVRASSVNKYGKSMLDAINVGKFAKGGIVWRGKKFDQSTIDKIKAAEADLGDVFSFYQGSYNKGGVGASKGTHDGGGVFDVKTPLTGGAVSALRRQRFAAWMRSSRIGGVQHIHSVEIGNPNLSPQAAAQARDYLNGGDGLGAGSGGATGGGAQDEASSISSALSYFGSTPISQAILKGGIRSVAGGTLRSALGGIETISNNISTRLHSGEMVLSRPLTEDLKAGIQELKYNIPGSNEIAPSGAIINSAASYQININAGSVSDPRELAQIVVKEIRSQDNRREFSRSYK